MFVCATAEEFAATAPFGSPGLGRAGAPSVSWFGGTQTDHRVPQAKSGFRYCLPASPRVGLPVSVTGRRFDVMDKRNLGGRPEIGPAFSVRFPAALLDQVDTAAAAEGCTRAGWLLSLIHISEP